MAMTAWQKQAETSLLKDEAEAMKAIEKAHRQAMKDIKAEIKRLSEKEQTPSVIYQKKYQEALLSQVSGTIDKMHASQYATMKDYLDGCYEGGYIASMYDIANQGIPVMAPIDQAQVVKAVLTDSKLSKPMYQAMGKYLTPLKKAVSQEISRGLAQSMHWDEIGAMVERRANIGLYNAQRIARTEGHRIQNAAKIDAMNAAKGEGADVVKQWDSTMDGKTRPHHRQLDGQVRELDEPFEIAGRKAMSPGNFGVASEDIQCRCVMLERARWALDDSELDALKEKADFWGLDKLDEFEAFKKKYIQASSVNAQVKQLTQHVADAKKHLEELDVAHGEIKSGEVVKPSSYMDFIKKNEAYLEEMYSTLETAKHGTKEWAKASVVVEAIEKLDEEHSAWSKQKTKLKKLQGELESLMKTVAKKSPAVRKKPKIIVKSLSSEPPKAEGYTVYKTARDADKALRPVTREQWARMTNDERAAVTKYTGSSYRDMNGILREGEYRPGRTSLDKMVDDCTAAIDKCETPHDMQVRRGISWTAAARMLGIPPKTEITEEVIEALTGRDVSDKGFMSCGTAVGTGFNAGVTLVIRVPKGSKAVYAEPFSLNSGTDQKIKIEYNHREMNVWDGESEGDFVGGECELLLQRGSHFRVEGIDADADGGVRRVFLTLTSQITE